MGIEATPEDIRRAEDWAYMLNRMGGVYLDHSQRQGLALQFAAHRNAAKAAIILSLRHDFDDWPDYVALADVADALDESTPKEDTPHA